MKAMLLKGKNQPLTLETVPDPVPGPGEAVARVLACGAGLTIHHARAGRVPIQYPRILGHEITAQIVATGEGVSSLKAGDAVTAYFYLTCGHCYWCRINRETLCDNFKGYVGRECDGGYAEYVKLPAANFIRLPEGMDWRRHPAEIGVICDAIATPIKVTRKARVTPTDTVAVIGAGGGLGVHMLMVARWAHARKVIAVDTRAAKFESCLKSGADAVIDASDGSVSQQLIEHTAGRGADVVFDFVGTKQTIESAIGGLNKGGRLVLLAGNGERFDADGPVLMRKEIEVMGSRYATKQEVIEALELVARGDLWPLVTEKVPFTEAEAVHQRLETGSITGRAALLMP
ncbi:MAG: NADPH:quinone oxidoreductase [Betaproteobacteria bacterium]|nr:MAG: NADPH:quinone oxidoreductase [Betaproteobacteria bacterium]